PEYVDRSEQVEFVGPRAVKVGNLPISQGLYRGHPVAVAVANVANTGRDEGFRLGTPVWITNGVDHGEGPYAQDVEDGNVRLRPQNLPGQPVQRTLDRLGVRFGEGVSADAARQLKSLRIGHGTTDVGA